MNDLSLVHVHERIEQAGHNCGDVSLTKHTAKMHHLGEGVCIRVVGDEVKRSSTFIHVQNGDDIGMIRHAQQDDCFLHGLRQLQSGAMGLCSDLDADGIGGMQIDGGATSAQARVPQVVSELVHAGEGAIGGEQELVIKVHMLATRLGVDVEAGVGGFETDSKRGELLTGDLGVVNG